MHLFFFFLLYIIVLYYLYPTDLYSKRAFLLLTIICSIEVFFLVVTRDTIMFSFDMLKIFICSFGIIICAVLKTMKASNQENGRTNERCAGICYRILIVGLFLLQIIFSFLYLDWVLRDGEGSAWMCFIAFLYIVTATSAFPPPENNTGIAKEILFYCGSVSLTIVNSVALATELIQKAKKGERTVEDLRIIVLFSESTFYACWLGVLMYENCDWFHKCVKDSGAGQQPGPSPQN
ncbi:hypothetical protein AGOR_G00085710 [Albula goreensis]|uniref:Uncharacterized protein n=1 Tax=Albula goreensis TaxID=1534307 RepID=A0A8T3DTV9_9TELE|nr:hypothetical protein AGOR_G00085710 [Albula goreensis]